MYKETDLFTHEKLADRLWIIHESYFAQSNLNIGVVTGDDWTMVIDSGMGMTHGLRKYIEENITDKKPMKCYLTHGHIDHCSGAPLFDEIHMHPGDMENRQWEENIERRFSDFREFCNNNEELIEYCSDKYVAPSHDYILDVKDGDILDLGGIKIEIYHIPGHSQGSVAYYDRQDNVLFSGDQISDHGNGMGLNNAAVDISLDAIKRLEVSLEDGVTIFHGHRKNGFGKEVITSLIQAIEDVRCGRTWDDEPDLKRHAMEKEERIKANVKKHYVNGLFVSYNADIFPPAER